MDRKKERQVIKMAEFVTLAPEKLSALREMNPCLMSYNIELDVYKRQ